MGILAGRQGSLCLITPHLHAWLLWAAPSSSSTELSTWQLAAWDLRRNQRQGCSALVTVHTALEVCLNQH